MFKLYQATENIQKNDFILVNNSTEARKATPIEVNEYYDYQQLVDELVDYCDLNHIDSVLEIVRDTIKSEQNKVIKAIRIHEEHSSKKCTAKKCICKFKYYNQKVKEQKIIEEDFKIKNNL